MLDLEKLSEYLRNERESDAVQELHQGLEQEIIEYLKNLNVAQDECSDYRELGMLRDEYKNAMLILEGLIERRFAKLVNYAVISITRQNTVEIKVHDSDKIVFDTLCNQMKDLKNNMILANCLVVKK